MAGRTSGQRATRYSQATTRYPASSNTNRMGRRNHARTTTPSSPTNVPAGYKSVNNCFQGKINSFKTLVNQTCGAAKYDRPKPAVLNSFSNWINKGAIIQTCTPAQVARWAKNANKTFNVRNCTPTTCKNVLAAKFGKNAIKAVARTKNGSFMVATSPTVKGRSFCFPK
jgi:hypothetical protein